MLSDLLQRYLKIFPEEKSQLTLLTSQVSDNESLNDRRNFRGHITGSGIVLSPDKQHVLLIHHKFFNLWQQPGGHWETDELNPLRAARREVEEETHVSIKKYLPILPTKPLVPLDIDSHHVPARPVKDEPPHYHHDIRYVFVARSTDLARQELEVNDAAWFALSDPATNRVTRCIEKLHHFNFV
jgi:8-oxo-dGTP pyrophosphatase MutT (NUDIX family)